MVRLPSGQEPLHRYMHTLRSRYSETDRMGYVYYGRYLEYFEVARTEMIRALGLPYSRMEDDGVLLPVVYTEISYKAPVRYDEEMKIVVSVFDPPAVRLDTWYELFTEDAERPVALGHVTLAFMDRETRRPRRAPELFLDRLGVQGGNRKKKE
ncbi:MAG: thioesterase family protein [Balneolaceae bacterium]